MVARESLPFPFSAKKYKHFLCEIILIIHVGNSARARMRAPKQVEKVEKGERVEWGESLLECSPT